MRDIEQKNVAIELDHQLISERQWLVRMMRRDWNSVIRRRAILRKSACLQGFLRYADTITAVKIIMTTSRQGDKIQLLRENQLISESLKISVAIWKWMARIHFTKTHYIVVIGMRRKNFTSFLK